MKRCPPGVICIENFSMFFLIICVLVIVYLVYKNQSASSSEIVINNTQRENSMMPSLMPSWPYFNSDPLLNPYSPPLRDERYFIPGFNGVPIGSVPINMSTNIGAVDTNYRQLGILNPTNGKSKDNIIPLMGRPLFTNRDKWQYYSTSNQHNNVKLPLSRAGRSCTNENGCDKLYNGDTVYIEGINEAYRVTVYDNDTIKYLPFV
jgi:hypothetical protein